MFDQFLKGACDELNLDEKSLDSELKDLFKQAHLLVKQAASPAIPGQEGISPEWRMKSTATQPLPSYNPQMLPPREPSLAQSFGLNKVDWNRPAEAPISDLRQVSEYLLGDPRNAARATKGLTSSPIANAALGGAMTAANYAGPWLIGKGFQLLPWMTTAPKVLGANPSFLSKLRSNIGVPVGNFLKHTGAQVGAGLLGDKYFSRNTTPLAYRQAWDDVTVTPAMRHEAARAHFAPPLPGHPAPPSLINWGDMGESAFNWLFGGANEQAAQRRDAGEALGKAQQFANLTAKVPEGINQLVTQTSPQQRQELANWWKQNYQFASPEERDRLTWAISSLANKKPLPVEGEIDPSMYNNPLIRKYILQGRNLHNELDLPAEGAVSNPRRGGG